METAVDRAVRDGKAFVHPHERTPAREQHLLWVPLTSASGMHPLLHNTRATREALQHARPAVQRALAEIDSAAPGNAPYAPPRDPPAPPPTNSGPLSPGRPSGQEQHRAGRRTPRNGSRHKAEPVAAADYGDRVQPWSGAVNS